MNVLKNVKEYQRFYPALHLQLQKVKLQFKGWKTAMQIITYSLFFLKKAPISHQIPADKLMKR